MSGSIFRKKSIEKVSSPDQLNDYIRVSNPSVWVALIAVIVLLAGACAWGFFGHLDTTVSAVAVAQAGQLSCYVREKDVSGVAPGQTVRINGEDVAAVLRVDPMPVSASQIGDAYALHLGELTAQEWVTAVSLGDTALADGSYAAQIVVDSVSPMSFVLN